MKRFYKILFVLFLFLSIFVLVLRYQTFTYPDAQEIENRINYLDRVVSEPLTSYSEISLLEKENHEFMLFTYAYTSYALTNLSVKDSTHQPRAEKIIKECILKTLDKKITSVFGIDALCFENDSIPEYSVLYLGHLNLMLGCYRLLSNDTTFLKLNDRISESLFDRYTKSEFLNLESYPSSIWIPDNTVALASLKLYSHNTGTNYDIVCSKWVDYAKENFIDERNGILYSTINYQDGKASEEARGSMIGWSIIFIYQYDENFAIDLYSKYKKNFSSDFFVLRLFKERYQNNETSLGDIDSGPIFLGYSIPANEFALGGAIIADDKRTAKQLERLIHIGAKTIDKNNEIRYKVRFIDMNISPMAEALVLNSLTITKWIKE
ncbi:hypothetical protein LJC00_02885 [Dysgonomonas sp. OttesenSCG-928-M03]|nr:hypothetical protein [Dysgonomonas sp. OttesenSCG-928-M03]